VWTPVPILLRRADRAFALGGSIAVDPEEQLLILAALYHRDPHVFGDRADMFSPDAAAGPDVPKLYVFSAHDRGCAGRSLVMFMLKGTLASLLATSRFELGGPAIDAGRIASLYDHFAIELKFVQDP
jgi:cytochrome P450